MTYVSFLEWYPSQPGVLWGTLHLDLNITEKRSHPPTPRTWSRTQESLIKGPVLRRSLGDMTADKVEGCKNTAATLNSKPNILFFTNQVVFVFFLLHTHLLMRTRGQCNCCRKHCADQRCNLRENEVHTDDLISLVGQAEARGFSDLSSWVSSITFVDVCVYVRVSLRRVKNSKKMSWSEELRWLDHLQMIQRPVQKIECIFNSRSADWSAPLSYQWS